MSANPNINRVSAMIRQYQGSIDHRQAISKVTQQQLDDLNKTLDMGIGEYCRYQELKSFAVAAGTLTLEEGQMIYEYLGGSLETFNGQPVAVKAVLTKVFEELLTMRIQAKRRTG